MSQKLIAKLNKVIEYPELEDLTVTPSLEQQKFKSDKYGYNEVTVNAIETEEVTIIPQTVPQIIEPTNRKLISKVNVNEVTSKIDFNIVAENIKKDITILGVTGTMEAASKPNIFMQETEPEVKEGIWLQSNNQFNAIQIEDTMLSGNGQWETATKATIPTNINNNRAGACTVGNYIYIFGGTTTTDIHKYDIANDTYEKLSVSNSPTFFGAAITSVGTDIYIVGASSSTSTPYMFKFNTLNNTSTQLTNLPKVLDTGDAVAIGTDIYIFASEKYTYKYNTLNDTYTTLANIPESIRAISVAVVGNDIYLCGNYNNRHMYKYNILTNTYTQLEDVPFNNANCGCMSDGNKIYLFGGTDTQKCYSYDTITEEFTQLTNIPYAYVKGASALVADNNKTSFYLFGGDSYKTKLQIYSVPKKTFEDKSIIIHQGNTYTAQIMAMPKNVQGRLTNGFNDAWYNTIENGLDDTIPTYYGDGSKWIKFKN